MKGPSIHVKNLSLVLGNTQILSDMSFDIAAGSIHGFIGPNGGGKTSTLRCLLGQMPHSGSISMEWGDDDHTIGYIPQLIEMEKTLPLTIEDFLAIVSQDKPAFTGIHKASRQPIDEVLDKVGLTPKRKLMIGSLSGGERQRLLFAQALLPAPALLVLDEPMASMDEAGVEVFEHLIHELSQQGTTVLWVNHDLKQTRRMANSVTVIDRGLLAHGPTETTLTEDMQHGVFRSSAGLKSDTVFKSNTTSSATNGGNA